MIFMAGYKEQLKSVGYSYDELTLTGYSKINGFCFTVKIDAGNRLYTLRMPCRISNSDDTDKLNKELQLFVSQRKQYVRSAMYVKNTVVIVFSMTGITADITAGVREGTEACLYYARQYGAVPSCQKCGNVVETDIYAIENDVSALCFNCFSGDHSKMTEKTYKEQNTVENVPLGIIGAILGGLTGAIMWILFSLIGRIVFVAGALSCIAGYFGYKLLGKKMSKKGLVISLVVAFVILIAGMYFSFALRVYNVHNKSVDEWNSSYAEFYNEAPVPKISFSEAFGLVPEYFSDNIGVIIHDYAFGVVIYICMAVICVLQYSRENKLKSRAVRLM